jgi:hypothetical protein
VIPAEVAARYEHMLNHAAGTVYRANSDFRKVLGEDGWQVMVMLAYGVLERRWEQYDALQRGAPTWLVNDLRNEVRKFRRAQGQEVTRAGQVKSGYLLPHWGREVSATREMPDATDPVLADWSLSPEVVLGLEDANGADPRAWRKPLPKRWRPVKFKRPDSGPWEGYGTNNRNTCPTPSAVDLDVKPYDRTSPRPAWESFPGISPVVCPDGSYRAIWQNAREYGVGKKSDIKRAYKKHAQV